jgi:hypothetical protein
MKHVNTTRNVSDTGYFRHFTVFQNPLALAVFIMCECLGLRHSPAVWVKITLC